MTLESLFLKTNFVVAIGIGTFGNGGFITIKDTVTKVTAIKGNDQQDNHIGLGDTGNGCTCGAVTIDPSLVQTIAGGYAYDFSLIRTAT